MSSSEENTLPEVHEALAVPENSEICPICRCPMLEGEPCTTTVCSHKYHFNCFMRMVQTSDTCALCRASLYPDAPSTSPVLTENTSVINTGEVIEIEVRPEDLAGIREQLQSRLSIARASRAMNNEDDSDTENLLNFEEDAEMRMTRLTFSIFQACERGELSRMRTIIAEEDDIQHSVDDENNTLVHEAIFADSEPVLRYLVNDMRLSPNCANYAGMYPIHFAAASKSTRSASILLNCGAFVDPRDDSGKTPLMLACQKSDNAMCMLLIDKGASVRAVDSNGESPLHHAARARGLTCIRTLLRHPREDPDWIDFLGNTPLHVACQAGSHTAVRFMLTSGADPDIKNRYGDLPIDLVPRDNSRLRSLIQRHSTS